jgi:hypothetical protein
MKVTAVLITREDAWPEDTRALAYPFDEVLIETRCSGVHRRYELARQAQHDVIYVQDDDCRLNIGQLLSHYDGRLTHCITEGHRQIYAGTGCTLIGWGCFFPKALVDFSRWDRCYGEGTIPSHEYDRVFTYFAQPHNTVVMPFTEFRRERAMSRDNPDHYRSKERTIQALWELSRREVEA